MRHRLYATGDGHHAQRYDGNAVAEAFWFVIAEEPRRRALLTGLDTAPVSDEAATQHGAGKLPATAGHPAPLAAEGGPA